MNVLLDSNVITQLNAMMAAFHSGVMKSSNRIPIGYIPAGSTNDFAKGLGVPKGIIPAANWIMCYNMR